MDRHSSPSFLMIRIVRGANMGKKKKEKRDVIYDISLSEWRVPEVANIADTSEDWMQIFASNVSIFRVTPHLIDGLKPGARRMLYAMKNNRHHGESFTKVVIAGSDTVYYHPHGDESIYDVIYKYGQSWRNNITYVWGKGNYGNIKGDDPAHPRYTECKLTPAANMIFFSDIKDSNAPMRPTYLYDLTGFTEPDYFPARIPTILCNPAFSSIAVGVATNIPPFNVSEVIAATKKLMKNPDAKIMLIPDSPTGCDIVDTGQFQTINDVGDMCTLTMQATYEIDYIENIITITSLPLQHYTREVQQKLVDLKTSGKLPQLIDIADESRLGDVKLKLILESSANPDKFIEKIMGKKTGLRDTYPVRIRMIDNFKSHTWGVRKTLRKWIAYRREAVRASYNKKLMDNINKHAMNEVYLMVFSKDNMKTTSEIARTSANDEEMIARFMKEYGITSVQASALTDMKYSQHSREAYERFKKVKVETEKNIEEYKKIIMDDEAVDKVIFEQMDEVDKICGGPRKSAVIKAGQLEEKIPDTYHLVGISKDGYIKKLDATKHSSIGAVGKTSQVIVTLINNQDNLLIFGDDGRLSRIGVSSIPDMDYDEPGVELTRYFTLTGIPVSILNERDVRASAGDIVIVTKKGYGKKVKMSEFVKIRDFKDCITLSEDDKLVAAIPAGDEDFIIYTNFGDGIRLNTSSIKYQSRNAKGLSLITLRAAEEVVGINFMESGCDKLVYVTSAGRMKVTDGKLLPLMDRKADPLSLIGLDPNEYVVGISFVSNKDSVIVYRRKSDPVEIPISDMKVTTRVAKPEKMVKTPSGDGVVAFKVVRK